MPASKTFTRFFESEKAGGLLLLVCTAASLALANSAISSGYQALWYVELMGMSLRDWVNDALMAVFFLLVGLELEREIYSGELSEPRKALLPIVAALGGVCVPVLLHLALNAGTHTQGGAAIPMATDIAFALAVLALLGERVPLSLKVFLTALAVMDDLAAIAVIALFYTGTLSLPYLAAALGTCAMLILLNVRYRVMALTPYLVGGAAMWFFLLKSGVHATIAGVLLAFAIPFSSTEEDEASPSHRLENFLHKPVAFVVLPLFALANTAIFVQPGGHQQLLAVNVAGIVLGLLVGKPVGITLASYLSVRSGLCRLPPDLGWRQIGGAGMLGGVGFTMSIFIANLAFAGDALLIDASVVAVLIASLAAGVLGYSWLRWSAPPR
jgi:Na+:H+ antiporter, NhaA family